MRGSNDGPCKKWGLGLASAYQPLTQTATMATETNPVEVLFSESQRLGAFAHFWRRRYGPPKFVTWILPNYWHRIDVEKT